ncbi:hypothetical protein NDU88_001815 [Pleurodeles waltl]|uniref:Secreted protein n=1 Tax=Pleurodeles waltl TaxID=8319 RepID=A0AAV7LCL1_PLEWA|nr:hypothetical protein NDU88_001815 [Pleurodeles waltl]
MRTLGNLPTLWRWFLGTSELRRRLYVMTSLKFWNKTVLTSTCFVHLTVGALPGSRIAATQKMTVQQEDKNLNAAHKNLEPEGRFDPPNGTELTRTKSKPYITK